MQQLGGIDNLMIEGEIPNIPMHIAAAMLYDSSAAEADAALLEHLQHTLPDIISNHLPILRCRIEEMPLQIDKAYWVEDEKFNLGYHLSRVALPAPHNWDELYRLFAQFHAQPLDQSRPLWEMMVVEGLDALKGVPAGSIALFVKIHHAVMDGQSAMRLLRSLHSLSPEADSAPLADSLPLVDSTSASYRHPPWWRMAGRAWWNSLERPVDMIATLGKLLPQIWHPHDAGTTELAAPIPRSRFNHPVAADRVVGHVRMNMATLKKLEKKFQCTINDIALCTVAGALRQYLGDLDELPQEDMVAAMPIDLRSKHADGEIGNQVTLARIHLHTDIADPAARLHAIQAQTSRSKAHTRHDGNSHALLNLIDDIHPALIIWLGQWLLSSSYVDKLPSPVNTVITNVPGIGSDAYLAGARLVDYLGFGPLAPNVGLFHTISSTSQLVNISFASTRAFIDDGKDYRTALEQSYKALGKLLKSGQGSEPAASNPVAKKPSA